MRGGMLQRDLEMTLLESQLGQVRAGHGRVVVVEGPAGIGKSTLLAHVALEAESAGMRVLRAWGSPLETQAGWGVARQLFAAVSGTLEWSQLAVGAAALSRRVLDPEPGVPAPTGDAMHAAAHGLTWLACGLAERTSTLLVVDDVHWADTPTIRWLAQLSRQIGELPLGLLCALRGGEPLDSPDVLAELLAAAPAPPVRPRPLGPEAVTAIVGARLPAADEAFAHACHAASAGNPFLLGALVDQLIAEDVEPTRQVGARLTSFGPEQVARSVHLQLSRLPRGAAELARAFVVIGRRSRLLQAAALAGLELAEAQRLADLLVGVGLLAAGTEGYALTHPLVAGALYRAMPHGERSLWHRRAAHLLVRQGADVDAIGLHLLHSEPAAEPSTVAVLREAAHRAGQRGAPESAVGFLRRALAEPPGSREVEAEVRGELGLALAAQVRPGARDLVYEAVDLATDPDRRLDLALRGSRALGLAGHFDDAVELCRRALVDPGAAPPEQRERLEVEMVCNMILQASTVAEARDRLRRQVPRLGQAGVWTVLTSWEPLCTAQPSRDVLARVLPSLDAVDGPDYADSLVGTCTSFVLVACGDLETATRRCDALIEAARSRGWLIALAHGSFMRAIAHLHAGRIHDARADAGLAFDFKVANSPPAALLWSLFPLVEALTELGELAAADEALDRGWSGDEPAVTLAGAMLLERRARLRLAQNRPADADDDLVTAADWWQQLGMDHPAVAAWRVTASEARTALGQVRGARRLALEHLELAERTGTAEPRGAGLRALARTVDRNEAVTLLEQAADLLADSPAQLERARTLVELGAALRRVNQRTAALGPLRRALDLAERRGMRLVAGRARHELAACGARPRRSALTGTESLTPAERQVARLAARGLSNKDIAQHLFVTRRTVETHLTHIYAKLAVGSRIELEPYFPDTTPASAPLLAPVTAANR
jgi:DNA-binding NarL/FixJ family response regulator